MNIQKIILIWAPDFLKKYKEKDFYNFNEKFWDYIFDPSKSWRNINHSKLSTSEKNDLKYIYSNLKLVYKYFKLMKHTNTWIDNLVFCFNIIDNYIKILNKFTKWVQIHFFTNFRIKDNAYENLEENIFYDFFQEIIKNENILVEDNCILHIDLLFSYQLLQLHILNHILNNNLKKNITFKININNLTWFENKKLFKQKILKDFNNVIIDESFKELKVDYVKFNGIKYYSKILFDRSCEWNKCSFCNMWKNKKLILDRDRVIETYITDIIDNQIKNIQICDASLTIPDMMKFSKAIIKHQVKANIKVFARFSDKFTDDVLELFWNAWIKLIWIWLESSSTRLNNLMNKYDRDYQEKDFSDLVRRCSKYWIQIHYYTIFWFPTETKEEIINTRNFLLNEVKENAFFTYTAWLFWLNKWTDTYINKDKYWIKFKEDKTGWEIFINEYYEKNYIENYWFIDETREEVITKLFFWNNNTKLDVKNFWYFAEHSNVFHVQQLLYNNNPYLIYFSRNDLINSDNLYAYKYEVNKYLQFISSNNWWIVKNWLFNTNAIISNGIYELLKKIDKRVSLNENINLISFNRSKANDEKILELAKGYFLIII